MSDYGTIYATWTDPTGGLWQLSNTSDDLGWFTTKGPGGWGAAPVELITDPLSKGGVSVRTARVPERRLTWPLFIWGETHLQFVERYRNIVNAFAATVQLQAPGTLRVARQDGTARSIDCWYEDGLTGEPAENWSAARPVLTLLCPEPYWRDDELLSVTRSFSVGVPFLAPYPTISNSDALGASVIQNPGDVEAWPNFTFTGPMTQMIATNNRTGDSFTVNYTLTAGQQLTITTGPPTATGPNGENVIGALDFPTAVLWSLLPGANDVTFTGNGVDVGTSVTLSFAARYETA